MKIEIFFLLLLFTISNFIYSQYSEPTKELNKVDKTFFIENKGQWPEEVRYLANIKGMQTWITDFGVVYDFYSLEIDKTNKENSDKFPNPEICKKIGNVVKLKLEGINNYNTKFVPREKQEGYYNYFIGNDKTRWAKDVGLYKEIVVEEIYEDISVRYYYDGYNLRYDYNLKPFADISKIKFSVEGAESYYVNQDGELVIKTDIGNVINGKIFAYQENGKEIECIFSMNDDGSIGFKTEEYDEYLALVIDPLVYSTFIGGSLSETAYSIKVDDTGCVYITGETESSNYPITDNAYDKSYNGNIDVFVTKLTSDGSRLIYSTFIGGSNGDVGKSIAIDENYRAFITGYTASTDYPTEGDAFDLSHNGQTDAFFTILNSDGTALEISTFLGGNSDDYGNSITIHPDAEDIYITGETYSTDFPTTAGAYDESFNGYSDVFVTRFGSDQSLRYSTYIGGVEGHDLGLSITIDNERYSYVTGYTKASDFPTTAGVYDQSFNDYEDAFILKLNSDGSNLLFSTYIGGNDYERGYSIKVDLNGNAYITGETHSTDFPTTSGAYDKSYNGNCDVFATKLNSNGSDLIYSTFIGGSGIDNGKSIAINYFGNAYIFGQTASTNYPVTSDAYDPTHNGGLDIFVTKLNSIGSNLVYSTFIGGTYDDWEGSIDIDNDGNVYLTGCTASSNYPTTPGAFDESFNGNYDVFVTKLYETALLPPLQLDVKVFLQGAYR
ncbi:MAG: SBBP repeat-containing protein [Ignavibacteriales bacterium]|nr:SBBP repeat-containing protein [Ignavibacteriales bacterium]